MDLQSLIVQMPKDYFLTGLGKDIVAIVGIDSLAHGIISEWVFDDAAILQDLVETFDELSDYKMAAWVEEFFFHYEKLIEELRHHYRCDHNREYVESPYHLINVSYDEHEETLILQTEYIGTDQRGFALR